MALSNILKEPRREIIETIIGGVIFGGFMWGDYAVTNAMHPRDFPDQALMMLFFPIFALAVAAALVFVIMFIHGLGNVICDIMKEMGLDPRPKQRYK